MALGGLQQLDETIRAGYTFIAYSVDTRILDVGSRKANEMVKAVARQHR